MLKGLKTNDVYYYVDFQEGDENHVSKELWFVSADDTEFCNHMNGLGLAFLTYEEAKAMAEGMSIFARHAVKEVEAIHYYKHNKEYKHIGPIKQGELVYITHANRDRCGWYQKLRKANGNIGYIMVEGVAIGTYVASMTIDMYSRWDSRAVMKVIGGENVARFIASGFSDWSCVIDFRQVDIRKRITKLEHEIENLKDELKEMGIHEG